MYLLACTLTIACSEHRPQPAQQTKPPGPGSETRAGAALPPSESTKVSHKIEEAPTAEGSAEAMIRDRLQRADAMNLRLFAVTSANWCRPCVGLKKYENDPFMVAAYKGIYLLRFDIDHWREDQLAPVRITTHEVPVFYEIGRDGKATGRTITSSVWGEDIPVNMAPPLTEFFAPSIAR